MATFAVARIPEMTGKAVAATAAGSGTGRAAARALAARVATARSVYGFF